MMPYSKLKTEIRDGMSVKVHWVLLCCVFLFSNCVTMHQCHIFHKCIHALLHNYHHQNGSWHLDVWPHQTSWDKHFPSRICHLLPLHQAAHQPSWRLWWDLPHHFMPIAMRHFYPGNLPSRQWIWEQRVRFGILSSSKSHVWSPERRVLHPVLCTPSVRHTKRQELSSQTYNMKHHSLLPIHFHKPAL